MSRMPEFSFVLYFLLSVSAHRLVLASGLNIGQEPQIPTEGASRSKQETKVTVLVHNYAKLPIQTLDEAKDRAELIFRKTGVEIQWADCPLNDEDPALYPKCPTGTDGTQLFLRVLPSTTAKSGQSGQAFVAARIANIFWNRVEDQAEGLNVAAPRFLAHVIAHELGHLLLGSNSHSTAIMAAQWDTPTVTRISQEGLFFNGQQSELIRSGVRKRRIQQRQS